MKNSLKKIFNEHSLAGACGMMSVGGVLSIAFVFPAVPTMTAFALWTIGSALVGGTIGAIANAKEQKKALQPK